MEHEALVLKAFDKREFLNLVGAWFADQLNRGAHLSTQLSRLAQSVPKRIADIQGYLDPNADSETLEEGLRRVSDLERTRVILGSLGEGHQETLGTLCNDWIRTLEADFANRPVAQKHRALSTLILGAEAHDVEHIIQALKSSPHTSGIFQRLLSANHTPTRAPMPLVHSGEGSATTRSLGHALHSPRSGSASQEPFITSVYRHSQLNGVSASPVIRTLSDDEEDTRLWR